jgi:competence protein ComEC
MRIKAAFDWRQLPYFRLLMAMLAGFGLAAFVPQINWVYYWPLALVPLLGLKAFMRSSLRGLYAWRTVPGILIFTSVMVLGATRWRQAADNRKAVPAEHWQAFPYLLIKIDAYAIERHGKWQAEGMLIAAIDSKPHRAKAGILIQTYDQNLAERLEPGQQLLVRSQSLQAIYSPENPHAFSYADFLALRGIHYQYKLASNNHWWYRQNDRNNLAVLAKKWKQAAIQIFRAHLPEKEQSAFAAALLLGDRSALNPALVKAYAASGAIHVLAVSGLHVGILFVVLHWLFSRALRLPPQWAVFGTLAGLWLYAIITGLPPSVSRACTMFSLLALAKAFKRDALVYNTIAAAAFWLLWWKPAFWLETGFQLSFAAVIGIIYLQPKIYRLLYIKPKWLDWLWQLSSVSLAAQLFTLPISIYYFNQFPNYFLLSNVVVIPAAAPLLIGSLMLLVVAPFPWLPQELGWLLGQAFSLVNYLIRSIEALPGSVSSGLVWSAPQTLLFYPMLLGLCAALWHNYPKGRRLAIWLGCIWLIFPLHQRWQQHQQQSFTLYAARAELPISFISGRMAWHHADFWEQAYSPLATHYAHAGISKSRHLAADSSLLIAWHGLRWFMPSNELKPELWPEADVLVLRGKPPIRSLPACISKYRLVLLDSSVSPYYCKQLETMAQAAGVACRSVGHSGAITLEPWSINTLKPGSPTASATLF